MATGLTHRTEAWWLPSPTGKGGVEELNEYLADIVTNPLIENGATEMVVLQGSGVLCVSLHDGRELYVLASVLFVEMIDIEGIAGIEIIDYPHGVPFHTYFRWFTASSVVTMFAKR